MLKKSKSGDIEIDLLAVIRLLWSKALLIILIAAIMGTAAFAYTVFMVQPTYKATASMYVNNSSFSFGSSNFSISASELSASNNLVNLYIYILESRTTLEQVIAEAGLPYTYEQLTKMVNTESVTGTAAFEVTVTSTDPVEAETIANKIAEVLPDRVAEIVDGSSVRIVDYAIIPAHRSGPSYFKNTAIGGILGAFIAAVWIIIAGMTRESRQAFIVNADELRRIYPDVPVLAVIPDMRFVNKKGYYSSYYGKEGK